MDTTKLKNRMNGKVQDLQSHVKAADPGSVQHCKVSVWRLNSVV